jgi:hypothetical protein
MRWTGLVACIGEKWNACRILVGKPEEKKLLGKPTDRWEDNILMDLREIRWGGMGWIHLAQDRDQWQATVNMVMNLHVPLEIFLSNWETAGFSRTQLHEVW